jgi:hypothetical protein
VRISALDVDIKCKRGRIVEVEMADKAYGVAPLRLFHVKQFLYNRQYFSGIAGEFQLQTPKYFVKASIKSII